MGAHEIRDLVTVYQSGLGKDDVQERHNPFPVKLENHLFKGMDRTGGIHRTNSGADACPGNIIHMYARFAQGLDDSNMSPSASRAAAEGQPDFFCGF